MCAWGQFGRTGIPNVQAAPTLEQRRQFDAYLAELGLVTPTKIQFEPEWDSYGWTLWVTDNEDDGTTTFDDCLMRRASGLALPFPSTLYCR
jgi:hypothetical protein